MAERLLPAVVLFLAVSPAFADCIDINADPIERLTTIVHIDDERAAAIVDGRPWPGVLALTEIRGIGRGRIRDIAEEGLACVGVRAPVGARETIHGVATVLDADTVQVAGETIRLIGIDAPEGEQLCQVDGQAWPCGHVATTAVYEMVGHAPVTCEVYGRDRYGRALCECRQDGRSLNAAIVQAGWALAWYPERGAVLGPRYDDEEAIAASAETGLWRGAFMPPWKWRRQR